MQKNGLLPTFVFIFFVSPALAQWANHVVISEIRYDERSGINEEFVELYNPTSRNISLEGWTLTYKSKTGTRWYTKITFTSDHQIKTFGFFLWGGNALIVMPDAIEESQKALGLSNSGAHIALRDPDNTIIDLVAWEGGDSPEGSDDAGKTSDGGSLERKAYSHSTSLSMAAEGPHENLGNGYDTDDNASDFVNHELSSVNPQNTHSPAEPHFQTDGSGQASLFPTVVNAMDTTCVEIFIRVDSNIILNTIDVLKPENWTWLSDSQDILLTGTGFHASTASISGDTLIIQNTTITKNDSGIITIQSLQTPDSACISTFKIRTAIKEGFLTPINHSPSVRVRSPVVPIIRLHQNTDQGQLMYPYYEGKEVRITGVVTVGSGVFSMDHTEIFIQDSTAGIKCFSSDTPVLIAAGDSVTTSGFLQQYHGMTELHLDWDDFDLHGHDYLLPEPYLITCLDINKSFWNDNTEPYEGCLIRVNHVTCGFGNTTISDTTGTAPLYLDNNAGLSTHAGTMDILGVLSQYVPEGPPYISGYQLVPRYTSDFLPVSGPQFSSYPEVQQWIEDKVHIVWQTDIPSTSVIHYGLTNAYGDSTINLDSATHHQLTLGPLLPATIYHYKVKSANEQGSNVTGDRLFISKSHTSSTGEIRIYFNGSVENILATQTPANGHQNLKEKLIHRINQAQYSIDACFYNMSDWDVQDALVNARNRNVNIRFIFDADHDLTSLSRLQNTGIPIIQDTFGENASEGVMHHKFAVFDHRNNTTYDDDWIWTGSYNPNHYGNHAAPLENAIAIQDQALAELYTEEFEEMWGSDSDTPDPEKSLFGPRKTNNTPHRIDINGTLIEVYMSPSDQSTRALIQAIQTGSHSIYFSIFSFTRDDISSAMYVPWISLPDFCLRGIFDAEQLTADGSYSQWFSMSQWIPAPDIFLNEETGILHHKYMIVDGEFPDHDPILVTGSQNWSTSGETKNDENLLIFHSENIANQYLQEFAARYHLSGGLQDFYTGMDGFLPSTKPGQLILSQNYPNPFNHKTIFHYKVNFKQTIRISLFNIQGKQINLLVNHTHSPGTYRISWDGKNQMGTHVSSGIYMVRIIGKDTLISKKLILIR